MYYLRGIKASFEYYGSRIHTTFNVDVLPDEAYYIQPEVAITGTSEEKL